MQFVYQSPNSEETVQLKEDFNKTVDLVVRFDNFCWFILKVEHFLYLAKLAVGSHDFQEAKEQLDNAALISPNSWRIFARRYNWSRR